MTWIIYNMGAGVRTLALMTVIVGKSMCETNIAFGKPTKQPSTLPGYGGLSSSRAVDGYKFGDRGVRTCAHTLPSSQNGWWYVDLGMEYRVKDVTVYTRTDCCVLNRQRHVRLSVGPSLSELTLCTEGDYNAGDSTEYTISCNRLGRFVRFEAWGDPSEKGVITLCEVVVTAWIDCSKCPSGVQCNNVTGCSQCAAGKLPPDCTRECSLGSYGLNCTNPCGSCASGAKNCTTDSGVCTQGCEPWWATDICDQEIVTPSRTTENITITNMTNSSITLKMESLKQLQSKLYKYYFYTIQHKTGPSDYVTGPSVNHSSGDSTSADVTGLEPYTSYDFLVTPRRRMSGQEEAGTPYPVITAMTACGYPDAPQLFQPVSADLQNPDGQASFSVTWNSTSYLSLRCEALKELSVEYRLQDHEVWTKEEANLNSTEHTIVPSNGGTYEVRVTVVNSGDLASSSDIMTVKVQGPLPPTTVTTTTVKEESQRSHGGGGNDQVTIISASVVVVVVVAVGVVLVVVLMLYRRKQRRNGGKRTTSDPNELEPQHADVDVDDIIIAPVSQPKPSDYDTGPVMLAQLESFTNTKRKDTQHFTNEYKSLPAADQSKCSIAVTDENKPKSRFKNIYPYNATRVVLSDGGDDYINATHITGYSKPHEYIATQGVKAKYVEALWRMIWQEGANRIVMVCNLTENGKIRCDQYWPKQLNSTRRWGEYSVTLESVKTCADYTIRILTVTKQNESRSVHHFHCTSWEDKSLPIHGATTLFTFRRKVRAFDTYSKGPMIVHCSAGVGRTGTFMAVDILTYEADEEGQVDIYSCVTKLRQQRMFMVQTEEQYVFLHDALVQYYKCGNTAYPADNFSQTFNKLTRRDQQYDKSELEKHFQALEDLKPTYEDPEGSSELNIEKNRDPNVVADPKKRPYLITPYDKGTNYINAVYASTFLQHKLLILTQMPLPHTIVDFWRLVYDQECHTIITLNDVADNDPTCPRYWPEKDKTRYGPLEVTMTQAGSVNTSKNIVVRDFTVTRTGRWGGDTKSVRQFQLLSWPSTAELPPSKGDLLELMDVTQHWLRQQQQQQQQIQQQRGAEEGDTVDQHVIVQCLDGASHSGMYCAATYVVDQIREEQEVNPFLAASYVTASRPSCFNTLAQYKFLYEMATEYLASYHEYANFQ